MKTLLPAHRPQFEKALDLVAEERFKGINLKDLNILAKQAPAILLPHLANSFNVDINGLSEDEARELIFSAFKIHFYAGTPYSLERALKSVYGNVSIQEWFEYSGEPYHFMVDINSVKGIDESTYAQIEKTIEKYKNVRSVLERIRVFLTTKGILYFGAVNLIAQSITIHPYQLKDINNNAPLFFGAGTYTVTNINIKAKG